MEELKQKLLDDCNNSKLPLEAILFVTKDLWRDVQDTILMLEKQKEKEQKEENKE